MGNRRNRSNFADQVADELERAIHTQRYPPGHQLPSIETLATDMEVGRSTIREALRMLQTKGLVEVVHGRGTFISSKRVIRSSGSLHSFTEITRERGMTPSSRILQQEISTASHAVAARLQIAPGDRVNVLKRLRFADGVPIALETSISPYVRFRDLLEQPWTPDTSFFALLREKYQVIPHSAQQTVCAAMADAKESLLLEIEVKHPILLVETITYDQHGVAIEFGQNRYRADRYEYRVLLKREE
ncbi:MAG: GntR family transcriptional regulator [Planctomycetaceae bacterium]|nr:MAG: GntR family transcriptional regulator [Planctomycetaceae bacterium]